MSRRPAAQALPKARTTGTEFLDNAHNLFTGTSAWPVIIPVMEAPQGNPLMPAMLAVALVALVVVIAIAAYKIMSTTSF